MIEKTNSAILKFRGKGLDLSKVGEDFEKSLTTGERKIFETRLEDLSIQQYEKDELKEATKRVVTTLCGICGKSLPEEKELSSAVVYQFSVFLKDFGFSNLNFSEVVLAFQLNLLALKNSSGVEIKRIEPYGDFFNVDYAAQVLNKYLELRKSLDRKIQNFIDGIQ